MHKVYISLGSNIERNKHITAALYALDERFSPLNISKAYDCEPVGFQGDNFLNLVVGFKCHCSVAELSRILRDIEDQNGRARTGPKFASRTLDLDILTFDDVVGTVDGVKLPRGEITENAFVLQPLADVAENEFHPVLNRSYQTLWQQYDKSHQNLSITPFKWKEKT